MTTLTAHFDGKVLVRDEPVELLMDCALEVQVQPLQTRAPLTAEDRPLMKLVQELNLVCFVVPHLLPGQAGRVVLQSRVARASR